MKIGTDVFKSDDARIRHLSSHLNGIDNFARLEKADGIDR